MFSRKNRSSADPSRPEQPACSPLPRLQQLTLLESQLISILGRRNIAVDDSADIFTRLQEIYLSSLQGSPLGMETLEKCLRVVGTCDSPARVRFLYLCAHQMVLKGAATDELQPVLLEAFHSGLALRHKVDLGFKAGLAFCQVSQHAAEVDKILSSLVVALEQELGYRPQRKPKQNPHPHPSLTISGSISHEATKAIYLGTSSLHKTPPNKTHSHGRGQKLELFKLLFEAFLTGSWRIQSQAKRKYYADCRQELRARLIREYPGRDLQKKLGKIEQKRCVALGELSTVIRWGMKSPEPVQESFPKEPSPNKQTQPQCNKKTRGNSRSKSTSQKQPIRSKSQAASSSLGLQSLKSSFIRDPRGSTWNTPTPTPGHSRQPSFKLHIRRSSKLKLQSKEPSERQTDGKEEEESTVKPEVTKLVFKESSDNILPPSSQQKQKGKPKSTAPAEVIKGIVLKFDRLHHEKAQVKKKKLRHTFNWDKQKQKSQKENQLQHVLDIQCLPQIKEQSPIPKDTNLGPHSPHQSPIISPDHSITHPSVSDLNSARRIDLLLKQGVQWIAHQQNQPRSRQVTSNGVLSQCQMLHPHRHEQSFSDTKLMSESIMEEQEEASREASYKIVIKTLEKPQVNTIIGEEVEAYLKKLAEEVVMGETCREQQEAQSRMQIRKDEAPLSKKQNRMMKPNRPSRLNMNSPCEVSIQIREQPQHKPQQSHDDSDCEVVEVASKIMTEDKLNSDQSTNKKEEASIYENDGDHILPLDLVDQQVNEQLDSMQVNEPQPKITVDFIKSGHEEEVEEVSHWLEDITAAIVQTFSQQSHAEQLPAITEQALPSLHTQQQPQSPPSSSRHYLPALPLSRLKCSIKAEHPSLSSQSGSVDDKQLSSQIKSCPSIEQPHLPPLAGTTPHIDPNNTDPEQPMQLLAPSVQGEERQGSHFTCSRFLGSKIDTEKESDFQWRSQMNFMNEIFKQDCIAEEQEGVSIPVPLLQIPEQHRRDSRLYLQQSQHSQHQRSNLRSRTQSQISNKSSKNMRAESASSRSLRREKTNVCISFSYSDNYEAVTHTSKKFNHWLCPELRVDNNQLIFVMEPKGTQFRREIVVPCFFVINDDTIREVSAKVQAFLGRFPSQIQLDAEKIAEIGRELENADLLPDKVQLPSLTITGKDGQQDQLKCVAHLKSLRIVLQSTKLFLRVNPIALHSLPELQSAISSLSPQKFLISNGEILPQGFYTFTGQRNIKLREKSQGAVNHLIFDVMERFSDKDEFDYCVRQQSGESLNFQGVVPARRGKILKNMDTIIGFCIKTVQGKAKLNGSNIKQFLTLL